MLADRLYALWVWLRFGMKRSEIESFFPLELEKKEWLQYSFHHQLQHLSAVWVKVLNPDGVHSSEGYLAFGEEGWVGLAVLCP